MAYFVASRGVGDFQVRPRPRPPMRLGDDKRLSLVCNQKKLIVPVHVTSMRLGRVGIQVVSFVI